MDAATGSNFRMRIIRRIAAACLAALPWSTARQADAAEPPLVIAKSGYLFAGGKIDAGETPEHVEMPEMVPEGVD